MFQSFVDFSWFLHIFPSLYHIFPKSSKDPYISKETSEKRVPHGAPCHPGHVSVSDKVSVDPVQNVKCAVPVPARNQGNALELCKISIGHLNSLFGKNWCPFSEKKNTCSSLFHVFLNFVCKTWVLGHAPMVATNWDVKFSTCDADAQRLGWV